MNAPVTFDSTRSHCQGLIIAGEASWEMPSLGGTALLCNRSINGALINVVAGGRLTDHASILTTDDTGLLVLYFDAYPVFLPDGALRLHHHPQMACSSLQMVNPENLVKRTSNAVHQFFPLPLKLSTAAS